MRIWLVSAKIYNFVAHTEDRFPVIREDLFSLRYILEDHRNRNAARANRANPLLKIIRHRDIREFLQHEMHRDRQTAAPVLVFYVRYVHQKLEDLCYEGRCEKVEGRIIVRHPDKECRFFFTQ